VGLQSREIALADRVRYHMNVFWENAPDRRTSGTPDWLNDACEARLDKEDRHQGKVTYVALMSPTWVAFTGKRPFRWARGRTYTGGSPISLLVTAEVGTTGVSKTTTVMASYALFGMKKRLGKRAAVRKYRWADTHLVKPDGFWCTLHLDADEKIWVGFATKFEVDVLVDCLKPNPRKNRETAAASRFSVSG
jgi:hypothetical protein